VKPWVVDSPPASATTSKPTREQQQTMATKKAVAPENLSDSVLKGASSPLVILSWTPTILFSSIKDNHGALHLEVVSQRSPRVTAHRTRGRTTKSLLWSPPAVVSNVGERCGLANWEQGSVSRPGGLALFGAPAPVLAASQGLTLVSPW
jgi:hypothetical protein